MELLRTSCFAQKIPESWSILCITRKTTGKSNDGDRIGVSCARVASRGGQEVRHDEARSNERLCKGGGRGPFYDT